MPAAAGTQPSIEVLAGAPDPDWNRYVDAHADGSVFHLGEWAAVYAALPWAEPCFLVARRGGAIAGVMPLARVAWAPGRRALVSAPYCVEAGALADDAAAHEALETAAESLVPDRRAAVLEVRSDGAPRAGWSRHEGFDGFTRALAADEETCFAAIPRKQRAVVRKGQAAGLVARPDPDEALFYGLFAAAMHQLGTPVYARRLFAAVRKHLGERVHTLVVRDGDRAIAAVMSFRYRGCELPYWAGAVPDARRVHAHDFMYWELMRRAVEDGCTRFDFGRSPRGSGAWSFKRHWGFEPRPLVYRYYARGASPPVLDPESRFNRAARAAWKRLPLALANLLGPWISRRLY